jgi:DNA-binding CsgD family transcriptional regulator
MLTELEVSLLAAQGEPAAALAAGARALAAASGRTSRLKRFLWPLLSATARVACMATRPGASDGPTVLAHDVLRQAAEHAASARPVSPLGRAHAAAYQAAAGQNDSGAWDSVASAWEQLSEPYRQAQALLHAAEAALAEGEDRSAVARRLRQAAALAEALGAGPLRKEISSLARRARLDIASGAPAAAGAGVQGAASLGLTGRELEVLRLVAAGRNNRDIAAELFISAKTASAHVSNILAKLGVHSRVEAAAIAHRAGVTGAA